MIHSLIIPLYCLMSLAASNDYPAYQYKADLVSNVNITSASAINDNNGRYIYSYVDFTFQASVYYYNDSSFYLDKLEFTSSWSIYEYYNDSLSILDTFNDYKYFETSITNVNFDTAFSFFLDYGFDRTDANFGIYWGADDQYIYQISHELDYDTYNNIDISAKLDGQYLYTQIFDFGSYLFGENSYAKGFEDGKQAGYQDGYEQGKSDGYQNGFAEGVTYGQTQNSTAVTIFSGIVTVGLLPINFFLAMLNFEVFGINIGGLVSAFLTIAIIVIIVRIVIGGGNKSSD